MTGKAEKASLKAKKPYQSPVAREHRPFEYMTITTRDNRDAGLILIWLDRHGFAIMRREDHKRLKGELKRRVLSYYSNPTEQTSHVCTTGPDDGHLSIANWLVFGMNRTKTRITEPLNGNLFDLRRENIVPKKEAFKARYQQWLADPTSVSWPPNDDE